MCQAQPEKHDELIQHLEKLTGRSLRTREDIHAYVREVSARKVADEPSIQRWLKVKKLALFALLAFGVMQYYIVDVMLEIVSMPTTTYFVPVRMPLLKSSHDTTG